MKQVRITIINASVNKVKDKKTGQYTGSLTKIVYAVERTNTENLVGNAILTCYKQGNLLKTLTPYVMKLSNAEIREDFTDNGSKWAIMKLNNVEL